MRLERARRQASLTTIHQQSVKLHRPLQDATLKMSALALVVLINWSSSGRSTAQIFALTRPIYCTLIIIGLIGRHDFRARGDIILVELAAMHWNKYLLWVKNYSAYYVARARRASGQHADAAAYIAASSGRTSWPPS